ncbi:carboxypeptidase [Bacillaceae bacterium JMAK1]|nr:carboxypeptidase [Bacillaceae bacterium JMAK1]
MKSYLQAELTNMLQTLETFVNQDSGSYDKEDIDEYGRMIKGAFESIGMIEEEHESLNRGNHRYFSFPEATPSILLLLHMDTVFKSGTVNERPFRVEGDFAYGPGVVDMKGSHVSSLYAIKALIEEGSSDVLQHVAVLFTSDEEIGATSSKELIQSYAKGKRAVLVMEPARKDGSLVTARRGGGRFTMDVQGKAAHAGINPEEGRSAIEELAHKTIALHQLSNLEAGISVNVGVIEGGSTVNTVAEHARAFIDVRISTLEQGPQMTEAIEGMCAESELEGTKVTVSGDLTRPPMERTEKTQELFQLIKQTGEQIGVQVTEVATGGSSDASFTSVMDVATIDGMGPVGGGAHSSDEYLEIPSLVERTHLLAVTIKQLSNSRVETV